MQIIPITHEKLRAALPDMSNTLCVQGTDGTIEIFRDSFGIPHVKAGSVSDAFFGQGFATAQDRLWHMDYDRIKAHGRWAEWVGESGVEQDKLMRRFQISVTVENDYAAINDEARAMLDAYPAGVNAFIETAESLPIEYELIGGIPEKWQPRDCLAVFKVRHILMGTFEAKMERAYLLNALGPEKTARLTRGTEPGHLMIIPPGAEYDGPVLDGLNELAEGLESLSWIKDGPEAGSNNWVLGGRRTTSGKPLMAGDPHRALDTPNVYYQNHISCPDFDAIGLSFPGCPGFPHFGHNADVAWCVTHAMADYQDLYIERFREDDPTLYEFKGEWKEAHVRREVIAVKGGQSLEMDVTVTHHGPVIAGDPDKGRAIAFKYTATAEPNRFSECLLPMMSACSANELEESMRGWIDPCNNFLFCDVQGDIGYLNRGQVPIRSMANAWLPVPGWTGEHEWQGCIPFEDLARSRNPDSDTIVTANNRIVGADYSYYIGFNYAPEYRARRITHRLESIGNATVDDMAAVHAERVSIPANVYCGLLKEVEPLDDLSAKAREKLTSWDGSMDPDAVEPTLYSAFRLKLHQMLAQHFLGPLAEQPYNLPGRGIRNPMREIESRLVTMAWDNDTSLLPPGTEWKPLLAQALAEGVSDLKERLGGDIDSWKWGRVHHTRPQHPLSPVFPDAAPLLNPPSIQLGGDGDTPQAAGYSIYDPFTITGTSVARYIFDPSDWDNSRWIVPLGASGHPGNSHYADQASTWGQVATIPMHYDWERIQAVAESHQILEPK